MQTPPPNLSINKSSCGTGSLTSCKKRQESSKSLSWRVKRISSLSRQRTRILNGLRQKTKSWKRRNWEISGCSISTITRLKRREVQTGKKPSEVRLKLLVIVKDHTRSFTDRMVSKFNGNRSLISRLLSKRWRLKIWSGLSLRIRQNTTERSTTLLPKGLSFKLFLTKGQ